MFNFRLSSPQSRFPPRRPSSVHRSTNHRDQLARTPFSRGNACFPAALRALHASEVEADPLVCTTKFYQ